jgi:hypothetical protein
MRRINGKLTDADRSGALFLLAHNPKVSGSNPAPATKQFQGFTEISCKPFLLPSSSHPAIGRSPLKLFQRATISGRTMSPWKRWVVIGISGGATLAVVGAMIIGGVVWFAARPTPWNTSALSVVWGKAETTYGFSSTNSKDFRQAGYSLDFAIQNNTNRDVTLSETATIMRRLTDGGVLEDYSMVAKPYKAAFIPAGQRAELSIKLDVGCTEEDANGVVHDRDPGVCYKDTWAEMDALVLFDHDHHLQVNLPKPVLKEFPPNDQKADPPKARR